MLHIEHNSGLCLSKLQFANAVFLSVCCRKVRVRLCIRIFLGKKTCFCSFGTPVFLLMLRNNLIPIIFCFSQHFALLAIVWTLLTRLTRKFLDFRWDLFLTLEELRKVASHLQNIVCHTLNCFLTLKLYFLIHHPNSDSFFVFFSNRL